MSVKIALANQKGGVGKTTSSIELASCFTRRKYKVLVVDLEQQSDTTRYSNGDVYAAGSYQALKGEVNVKDAIQHVEEFDLLSANPLLSNADDVFTKPTDVIKLKSVLMEVDDIYDFIIIDTNPGRNRLLNMAYIAADYIIIPTDADDGSVNGIEQVYNDLTEYKNAGWSDAEILGVIFTRYEKTGMHKYQELMISELMERIAPNAFVMKVSKSIVVTEVKTERTTLQAGKKRSNPAKDYKKIADKIIKIITEE